jgi:hypothetical protein
VKGRKIALKVERRSSLGLYSAGTTRAKRVCCSLDILNALLDERCLDSIEEVYFIGYFRVVLIDVYFSGMCLLLFAGTCRTSRENCVDCL